MGFAMDLRNQINEEARKFISRRWFFKECGVGLGSIALASMMHPGRAASAALTTAETLKNPLAPKFPHFAPKAKRVIFLFQAGAPSHLDLFDFKPELAK